MSDNLQQVRQRLRAAVQEAERNEEYHRQLKADLPAALKRFDLVVEHVSWGLDDPDPPGCADGTCFTSMCPETCYVTICSPSGMQENPGEGVIDPAAGAAGRVTRGEP